MDGTMGVTVPRVGGNAESAGHALLGLLGVRYALVLTAGNVSDVKAAPALLERAGRMRYLFGDNGYDADQLRRSLRDAGAVHVIPGHRNRNRAIHYDKDRCRGCHLIEKHLLPPQGLPPRRQPLRQARRQLPLRRRARTRARVRAVKQSPP